MLSLLLLSLIAPRVLRRARLPIDCLTPQAHLAVLERPG
jgi:hypothetical protein